MAYGRDAQAEEILLEAKQKDPQRLAIHLKLLEIYANRKDLKQFEQLATDLYSETGGVGADWEKAAAMGLRLDPDNPLFGAKGGASGAVDAAVAASVAGVASAAFDADATVIVPSLTASSTVTMPGVLSKLAEEAAPVEPVVVEEPAPVADLASLDFDLGFGDEPPATTQEKKAEEASIQESAPALDQGPLDFDLGSDSDVVEAVPVAPVVDELATGGDIDLDFNFPEMESSVRAAGQPAPAQGGVATGLDFDLALDEMAETAPEGLSAQLDDDGAMAASKIEDDGVEFDVSLTESTFLGRSAPDAPSFDMASIDLDLGLPEIPEPSMTAAPEGEIGGVVDFESALVSTAVNPDFAREQAETIVSPNFASAPEPDMLPEQDFSFAQLETQLNQAPTYEEPGSAGDDFATTQEETVVNPQFGASDDLLPDFEISANEEVATKLDLAKAYEEMGDFEGASELLQEVLKEGDAAQKERAQAILAKINT